MAVRGPKGGAARAAWRAEEELRPMLTEGFSPEEWAQSMQAIGGVERGERARIASLMGRGGGAFDPTAFARATAPVAGGTQRAIGGLRAREAEMRRQGMMQWLRILQGRTEREQARRAASRAGTISGLTSMFQFGTQALQAGGRRPAPGAVEPWNIGAGPIQTPTYPAGPTRPYEQSTTPRTPYVPSPDPFAGRGPSPTYDWMHTPAWRGSSPAPSVAPESRALGLSAIWDWMSP